MRSRVLLTLFGLATVSLLLLDTGSVWARAGSGGSRGSRSYSTPARPAPSPVAPAVPSSPSRQLGQPQPQRPGLFGGLMGGIAGFALGGLLGSLLFGGLGGGFGIGLFDLLILGGLVLLVASFLRRREPVPQPAYAGAGSASGAAGPSWSGSGEAGAAMEAPAAPSDLELGIGHIRHMNPGVDPVALAGWAQRVFVDVQDAIARRDVSLLGDRLTPQEYARLQAQCDQLRGGRRRNRVEQIQVKRAEVTEAWQEGGQDWAAVSIAASLVDYTVDDATGGLVDGSKSPQDVEEYWTFTRPVGPRPWRLSAIQTS